MEEDKMQLVGMETLILSDEVIITLHLYHKGKAYHCIHTLDQNDMILREVIGGKEEIMYKINNS